jgi:hypothetical protein
VGTHGCPGASSSILSLSVHACLVPKYRAQLTLHIIIIIITSVLVAPMSCAKKTFVLFESFSFQGMTIIWFKAMANAFQVYVSSTWFPHVS